MTSEHSCPVCGSSDVSHFLSRKNVPVHQNLVFDTAREAREIDRGDLELFVCEKCGFVFNGAFDLSKLGYGPSYDNTQTCSGFFREHVDRLIDTLVDSKGAKNARIVEVGCGNGEFVRELVKRGKGNVGYGFDPSHRGEEVQLDGRLRFYRKFYDEEAASIPADLVVSRHVIEHVPEPVALLRTIRAALAESPGARVFFETPCVKWILENQVFWDFFYEHCSLFTAESLSTAFELAGFRVEEVGHVFEGQYLWIEATVGEGEEGSFQPGRVPDLARQFTEVERRVREEWTEQLQTLRARGPVSLWGAGAKGVTCANLIDPDLELIDSVVDLNPKKQGHFVPGTGHPIVDPRALADRGVASAILLNPNYRQENLALLSEHDLAVDLV